MTSVFIQAGSQTLGNLSTTNRGQRTVEQIEAIISGEVWKKQIRMKTFFEDYDKLRKGYCVDDKFISGLNTALSFLSINLIQEDIKALVNKYSMPPGDLIRYKDFVNTIDAQFFNTDLARSNLQFLKGSHIPAEEEQEILNKLLAYIRWMVSSKRILIKSPLQDYDRTKCSFITKDQFGRVLDNLGLVQNEKLADLLSKKYARSNNPKEVSYVDFIKDVEDIRANEEYVVKGVVFNSNFKESRNVTDPHSVSLTQEFYVDKKLPTRLQPIGEVLKKIQAIVTLRRIRVRQFFLDFDGLRKNIVTGEQFKRIMHSLGIVLSEQEYQEILNLYRVDSPTSRDERIKWMNFCDDIDEVFTTKEIEKDPLKRVNQIDSSVFEPVKKIAVQFTNEEKTTLDDLLEQYRTAISHQRVLLKPLFEDFDITKIGYVTKNQFARILKQFNYVPPEQQFNLLLKKYMDKGNLNEVNYYAFCRDVDKYFADSHQQAETYAKSFEGFKYQPRVSKATIKSDIPDGLDDLLNRIRRKVKQQRIRLSEFMRDFDKLRHGNIAKEQFRLSLGMAKLPLSEAEFTLIMDYFECPDKPKYVRWKDFCETIDSVFTVKELEKTSPIRNPDLGGTQFVYGREPINEGERQTAEKVKDAFREYLLANRMDTKDLFRNWDKLSRFKVSPKQFRQVLATVGFDITDEQAKAICKLYITDDQKEVKYLDFLNDTKPYDFAYMTTIKDSFKKGTGKPSQIPQTIEQILFEIRKTAKTNRLRFKQYFKDFDPLNKGTVKKNKFRGVIFQTMKVPLDEKVFQSLQRYYEQSGDPFMINYGKFLSDIDIVFNLPDNSKDPVARPPNFDYTITHCKKEAEDIDSLMRRLGEVVRKHRLLLKPFFQDKDVSKIGKVSFTRTRSILDNNKLPLTDHQYSLLCQSFSNNGLEFDYVDFIEALKQYEASSQ